MHLLPFKCLNFKVCVCKIAFLLGLSNAEHRAVQHLLPFESFPLLEFDFASTPPPLFSE